MDDRLSRRAHDLAWLEVLRFAAGLAGDRSFWPHLARLATRPDRYSVLDLRLARLVAERRPSDGGRALLGVDLRPRLWAAVLRGLEVERFAEVMAELDSLDLLERIEAALPQAAGHVRAQLLFIRNLVERPEAVAGLVERICQGDEDAASIACLGRIDERTRGGLREIAADIRISLETRGRAVRGLGRARDHGAVPVLLRLLDEPDIAEDAAHALGLIGGPEAVEALSVRIDHNRAFIKALGICPDREARDRLIEALAARDADDAGVLDLLESLAGEPFHQGGALVISLLEGAVAADARAHAARALGDCTWPEVTDALVRAARSDLDPAVRVAALGALRTRARPVDAAWLDPEEVLGGAINELKS